MKQSHLNIKQPLDGLNKLSKPVMRACWKAQQDHGLLRRMWGASDLSELGISKTTIQKRLRSGAYTIQLKHETTCVIRDSRAKRTWQRWSVIFTEEATFHANGCVSRHSYNIWGHINQTRFTIPQKRMCGADLCKTECWDHLFRWRHHYWRHLSRHVELCFPSN